MNTYLVSEGKRGCIQNVLYNIASLSPLGLVPRSAHSPSDTINIGWMRDLIRISYKAAKAENANWSVVQHPNIYSPNRKKEASG